MKDLIDLVTIARSQSVNLRELQMAIDANRALSRLEPLAEFAVPAEWEWTDRPLAVKTPAVGEILTLTATTNIVKQHVDRPSPTNVSMRRSTGSRP